MRSLLQLRADPVEPAPDPGAGSSGYALVDLGDGRRLEQFGSRLVDRPFPAAVEAARIPSAWAGADLRYERPMGGSEGQWVAWHAAADLSAWTMADGAITFELRPSAGGQVGYFAEQREVWRWLRETIRGGKTGSSTPMSVLNLFAYTGGSTLACAMEGAAVAHVDASKAAIVRARRNAELSGLEAAPVRWIVDDARAFTAREGRRGRTYDGIVLDPPSYGLGAGGQRWILAEGLPPLLDACLVAAPRPAFVVLTAHSEGVTAQDLAGALAAAFSRAGIAGAGARVEGLELELRAQSGAATTAGVMARWRGNPGRR